MDASPEEEAVSQFKPFFEIEAQVRRSMTRTCLECNDNSSLYRGCVVPSPLWMWNGEGKMLSGHTFAESITCQTTMIST